MNVACDTDATQTPDASGMYGTIEALQTAEEVLAIAGKDKMVRDRAEESSRPVDLDEASGEHGLVLIQTV